MKSFVLATLERRSGLSIRLKYPNGLTVIGDMHFNSSLARHELELSEADFLKHSKAICMLARLQGCAVYVAEIKDDETAAHERERAPEVDEFEAGYNLAMDGRELPDEASEAAKMGWLCVHNKNRSDVAVIVPQGNGGHPRGSEESVNLAIHEAAMGSPLPMTDEEIDVALQTPHHLDTKTRTGNLPEITSKSAFFAIKSAAKREGVDISGCKTNSERADAINAARAARFREASTQASAPSAFAKL